MVRFVFRIVLPQKPTEKQISPDFAPSLPPTHPVDAGQTAITEIQNLLSNSKVRNVIHSGRITFRVLTNYIPRLGELQSAVMANYIPRSRARPTP